MGGLGRGATPQGNAALGKKTVKNVYFSKSIFDKVRAAF